MTDRANPFDTLKSGAAQIWRSARLVIAFHRSQDGQLRDSPVIWQPKNGSATIVSNPGDAEVCVDLKSCDVDNPRDAQIKLHPERIVVCRSPGIGWEGVVLDHHRVRLSVNDKYIVIEADGSVTIASQGGDDDCVRVGSDGSVSKFFNRVRVSVSHDGVDLEQDTPISRGHLSPGGIYFEPKGIDR